MAAYQKQTWVDGETITKAKFRWCEEEGIANIELIPGPKGEQGTPGEKGNAGPKGADAVINKLNKVDALDGGAEVAAVVTAFNNLIADLKAKGLMNRK